jgi:hypothetical protein
MIEFHGEHGIAIEAVTFEVFGLADGELIMVREIETPSDAGRAPIPPDERLKGVLAQAEKNNDRAIFEDFLAAGHRHELYVRPFKVSLMFTAPANKTRMLFTIWTEPERTRMYTSSETFEEFFPEIWAEQARHHLGPDGSRKLDQESAAKFLSGLEHLLAGPQSETPNRLGSD